MIHDTNTDTDTDTETDKRPKISRVYEGRGKMGKMSEGEKNAPGGHWGVTNC